MSNDNVHKGIDKARFAELVNSAGLQEVVDFVSNNVEGAAEIDPDVAANILATGMACGAYIGASYYELGITSPEEELEEFARKFPYTIVSVGNVASFAQNEALSRAKKPDEETPPS